MLIGFGPFPYLARGGTTFSSALDMTALEFLKLFRELSSLTREAVQLGIDIAKLFEKGASDEEIKERVRQERSAKAAGKAAYETSRRVGPGGKVR